MILCEPLNSGLCFYHDAESNIVDFLPSWVAQSESRTAALGAVVPRAASDGFSAGIGDITVAIIGIDTSDKSELVIGKEVWSQISQIVRDK